MTESKKLRYLLHSHASNRFLSKVCHDGAWVENKGAVLTFHYRETPDHLRPEMVSKAEKLMTDGGLNVGKGHCVLEARPPVSWNKGHASLYILRTAFGDDWKERVRVIYAGDDVTDEDAMQVTSTLSRSQMKNYLCIVM